MSPLANSASLAGQEIYTTRRGHGMTSSDYTRQEIERVTAQFPNLCGCGFRDEPHACSTLPTDERIVEVNICAGFIRQWCNPTKRLRRSISSYGWKHVVENAGGRYVCNGAFIAAAILGGYRVKRRSPRSPNAVFNMRVPSAALCAYIDNRRMGRSTGVGSLST
jgi:hypothetical protein